MADLTYYDLLGVDVMASSMEIMEAYLSKQVIYDEDGDEAGLTALNHAYEVLSDPNSRQAYDYEIGVEADVEEMQTPPREKEFVEVVMEDAHPAHNSSPFDVDTDAPTHYERLGVEQMATSMEIMEAYLALRTEYEESGDEVTVTRLQEAYSVLSNGHNRERYDRELARLGMVESPFEADPDEDVYDYPEADDAPASSAPLSSGKLIFPTHTPKSTRPKRRIDGISANRKSDDVDDE